MKNNIVLKVLAVILILVMLGYSPSEERLPVEELEVPSAAGIDIDKINSNLLYKLGISYYIFQEGQQTQKGTSVGEGFSPLQARQNRALKISKNLVIGVEKVDIIGEEAARTGIRDILDLFFNNPDVNDTALMAVCEGKAKDFININVVGYPTSGDYIEQMINSSKSFNFFENNYKIIDVFVRVDSEGRKAKLPYIKRTKDGITIDGLAVFKNDKMVQKINIEDTKILNMLSNDSGKGVITIQKNSERYTDFYTKVKRKVKCLRKNGKYIFDINLDFKGNLVTNQYNKETQNKLEDKEKLEKELKGKIEKQSNEFINKMQKLYKIDCLELGRIAAAKYGRGTGTDWDKVISNSDINVNAKVNIISQGRGSY